MKKALLAMVALNVIVLLVLGYVAFGGRGKVVARLERKEAGDTTLTVTVRRTRTRDLTELSVENEGGVLPVASYEFFSRETSAAAPPQIEWGEPHHFWVKFENGDSLECSLVSRRSLTWTRHLKP